MHIHTWKMIHIGFRNHFIHRYSFTKVTKPILKSGDFNTCLICSIETEKREREREWIIKQKRKCMYQMTTITDYIAHSIISLNKKKKRKKEREDSCTSSLCRTRQRIMIVLWRLCTWALTLLLLLLRLPPVNIGLVARERNRELSHWMKKHIEIV
jgi:hypothetical protein